MAIQRKEEYRWKSLFKFHTYYIFDRNLIINGQQIYLDNGMNERRDRDICVESLTFNVSRREKLFDSRTSFCRNVDCVDLEPVLRLFMTVLDLPNEREERRERERERGKIHNPRTIGLIYRCSRTDMGPRPHEALQQAPGCWIRGSCVVEQHRVECVFSPFPVHSFSTLRSIPCIARFSTPSDILAAIF